MSGMSGAAVNGTGGGERVAAELRPGDLLRHEGVLWRCSRVAVSVDAVAVNAVRHDPESRRKAEGAAKTLRFAPGELVRVATEAPAPRRDRADAAALP